MPGEPGTGNLGYGGKTNKLKRIVVTLRPLGAADLAK